MVKSNDLIFGGWSIESSEWDSIEKFLYKYNIKSVVEFGMGVSTYLLKQVDKYMGYEMRNESIKDHEGELVIRRDLRNAISDDQIAIDLQLAKVSKFDLAFVDGPPAHHPSVLVDGMYARLYSVQAAKKMADIVLMHDTARAGEKATIDKELAGWYPLELDSPKEGLTAFKRTPWETSVESHKYERKKKTWNPVY